MQGAINSYLPTAADAIRNSAGTGSTLGQVGQAWNGLSDKAQMAIKGAAGLGLASAMTPTPSVPQPQKYNGPLSKFKWAGPDVNYTMPNVQYDPSTYTPYTAVPNVYTPQYYAEGGITSLHGYSDGGQLLKGPGDGVSDGIPAVIGQDQPARLADGEFVIPARIVSELGNGSTDAGAKQLYAMMDRIQAGRRKTVGGDNFARDTHASKHLPG